MSAWYRCPGIEMQVMWNAVICLKYSGVDPRVVS